MIKGSSQYTEHCLLNLTHKECETLNRILSQNLDSRMDELSLRFQSLEAKEIDGRTERRVSQRRLYDRLISEGNSIDPWLKFRRIGLADRRT